MTKHLLFSVVTISFNQARYLPSTIKSILGQSYKNFEYIIVDAGSSDGSRDIIKRMAPTAKLLFESDDGPADGLNKGFALASGDIFCYLNSDDEFLPWTLQRVSEIFNSTEVDVVIGHARVIDENGRALRVSYSDFPNLKRIAYGASVQMQPSTFIRRSAFIGTGGFNVGNKIAWDGELIVDLVESGRKFLIVDEILSNYRVHRDSITGAGKLAELRWNNSCQRFKRIMGRDFSKRDKYIRYLYLGEKYFLNPNALLERLRFGPVFGRFR